MSRKRNSFCSPIFLYTFLYLYNDPPNRKSYNRYRSFEHSESLLELCNNRAYIYIFIVDTWMVGGGFVEPVVVSVERTRGVGSAPARGTMPRDNKHRKKLLEERRETIHHPTGSFPRWPGFLVPRITRIGRDTSASILLPFETREAKLDKFEFFETSSRWLEILVTILQNGVYRNGREIVSCVGN